MVLGRFLVVGHLHPHGEGPEVGARAASSRRKLVQCLAVAPRFQQSTILRTPGRAIENHTALQ